MYIIIIKHKNPTVHLFQKHEKSHLSVGFIIFQSVLYIYIFYTSVHIFLSKYEFFRTKKKDVQ